MDIIYKTFKELSSKQLEDVFRLRQQVFIIEQNCFYEDIDGYDDTANHLLFYEGDKLAAYLRVFEPGLKYEGEASLGRIVVSKNFRGTGLGAKLVKKGIELCRGVPIRIEAQAALKAYYNQLGFKEEGEVYSVDDIDHLQMTLT
ncbi:MAG: GNAT family N-acetyltransferase [Gracilimonas sp.]|uniref:GNAT family N-acetyltransferase n=1 Tax=Gracilimonas sp. TaxID=1974203 RepID=UPI0019A5129B|nr:GNAT family N-acetyltransferase [Gracilimonas sp.]MBD3616515.1 GNAT family N-acetyltransferase [Gracilimonas sp.]